MDFKIKMSGVREAVLSLALLDKRVRRKLGIAALRDGAKPLKDRAKSLAPRGRTGRLKRSIAIKAFPAKSRLIAVEVVARRGKTANDRNGAFYAHMVEFGTTQQAAQSFLRTAADETKKIVIIRTGNLLRKQVDAEFRK